MRGEQLQRRHGEKGRDDNLGLWPSSSRALLPWDGDTDSPIMFLLA
ncbi:hypothetical protein L195_g063286, partial [Trifolium pratense]